jgi:hypothetical protein
MDLIDWPSLARNALWILGLSVVLAAWSYVAWLAARRGVRTRRALEWPVFVVPASSGLMIFAISLAWGATRTWQGVLWIVLAAAFLAQVAQGWREARRQGWQPAPTVEALSAGADDDVSDG